MTANMWSIGIELRPEVALCTYMGFLCFRRFLLSGTLIMRRVINVDEAHSCCTSLSDGKHNNSNNNNAFVPRVRAGTCIIDIV